MKMSKYTEAIADILGLIKPTTVIFEEEKESLWTAVEALQIADRLEQMWEEVKDKEFPHSMFQNCRDCGDYMQGKKDALADIRGENND